LSEPGLEGARPARTLRGRALRGSAIEVLALGGGQALRLASNLITTRLLFPEAFGLMALVGILMQGLELLSDVGLQVSVVQNRRGDERRFLDTIWTIQVVRGFALAGLAILLAWPAAWLYDEPRLRSLLPVAAAGLVLGGFNSTALYSLRRHLELGRLALVELASQSVAAIVTIGWAWVDPDVWALVAGGLARGVVLLALSHALRVGGRNGFAWDAAAARDAFHFGKWIFGSSAFHFVARQADRLLLGRYIGMSGLGVYSIAVFLSEAFGDVATRLTHGVLFPALSAVHRSDRGRVPDAFYRARLPLDAGLQPALGFLAAAGSVVVGLLYDARYAAAGWMLQAFAGRVALYCLLTTWETCLFAVGQTRYGFFRSAARAVWILVALPVGWTLAGLEGVVAATALSELPVLAVLLPAMRRHRLLRVGRELLAIAFFLAGAAFGGALVRLW
jgi:O-antigen/teichoic acid export membrane protein